MKRLPALSVILLAALLVPPPAHAQRIAPSPPLAPPASVPASAAPPQLGSRITAVVNDNVITSTDLNARMAMAFLASGLPDTPEVRQRLLIQLLHTMVDEQLELQEAKKLGITVTPKEIDDAMAKIAHDNNIPGGDIKAYLNEHSIPPSALENQIRAGLSWSKVIQRELRPRVDVGDDEVDAVIDRTRANAGKEEYLVSEIFLSVDNPKDDEQIRQFAGNLAQKLKDGGNFGNIARQFSQNASAAAGGDIGWIEQGQLPPELDRALESLKTGQITDPILAPGGYYILGAREKRTITLGTASGDMTAELQQAFRPINGATSKDAVQKDAERMRAAIADCTNLKGKLASQFPAWRWQDLGEVKLASAPGWLADQARALPVGKPSEAMATGNGALVLFVCSRKTPEGKADRESIANQIGGEKLELQARGLLRDLRRDAYLDVRL